MALMTSRLLCKHLFSTRSAIRLININCRRVHSMHSFRYTIPCIHPSRMLRSNVLLHSKYQFSNHNDNEFGDIGNIEPLELHQQRGGKGDNLKYVIIDVREPSELSDNYNLGENRKDWVNIPKGTMLNIGNKQEFDELLSKKGITDLDEYQDIYFLCRAGVRSMAVAKHCVMLDLDQTLFNITGGIMKYDQDVGLD
eukprot:9843_1